MEIFNKYADIQDQLLLMICDDDINKIKDLIDMNDLFKNSKYIYSTLNLIGSVVYARPHLLHNAVKLLNLFDNIQIDIYSTSQLEDEETIIRQVITKILLSLSKHNNLISDYDHLSVINPIKFCKQYNYGSYLDFETIKKMPDDKKIEARNTFHSTSPIVQAMIDDKIDLLQDLISKNNFDINQKLKQSLFEVHYLLRDATPLEYSAFLGAVNCFKFLLMKTKSINYSRLLECAIAGGNVDIIHITENESHDENIKSNQKLLYLAILYMHDELIDYILHSYKVKVDAESFNICIYSSNYTGMKKLIEFGDLSDINNYGKIGSAPLDIAAFEGNYIFFKFLLTIESVDVYTENSYGKTILHSAARNDKIDIVKYIVKNKLIDPNSEGSYGCTPLNIAENYYNEEVIDFLSKYQNGDDHEEEEEEDD